AKKEREGFEPSIVLCSKLYRFSRPELSTPQPSLRKPISILLVRIADGHKEMDTTLDRSPRLISRSIYLYIEFSMHFCGVK
ncbi:hypothetical protein M569_00274, partial [Genlisea aurea]